MNFQIFFFSHLSENAAVEQCAVFGRLGWCFVDANTSWLYAVCTTHLDVMLIPRSFL